MDAWPVRAGGVALASPGPTLPSVLFAATPSPAPGSLLYRAAAETPAVPAPRPSPIGSRPSPGGNRSGGNRFLLWASPSPHGGRYGDAACGASPLAAPAAPPPLASLDDAFAPLDDGLLFSGTQASDLPWRAADSAPLGRDTDASAWVCAFGFPPADAALVLGELSRCGDVLDSDPGPAAGNYLLLRFGSKSAALAALGRSGCRVRPDLIIGVQPLSAADRAHVERPGVSWRPAPPPVMPTLESLSLGGPGRATVAGVGLRLPVAARPSLFEALLGKLLA